MALGIPYNIASYALLLELMGRFTGIKPGIFAHTLVDAHIYVNHKEGLQEQLRREPRELPKLVIDESIKTLADVERLMAPNVTTDEILSLFKLEGYDPHPAIKFEVAV